MARPGPAFSRHDEKKSLALRPQVVRLARAGWSRRAIMAELGVSRGFVDHWAGDTPGPLEADQRGWPTGTARRYPPAVLRRVQALHQQLVKDPTAFFTGATAIQQAYARRYPRSPLPSLRTLGRMLRALGCSTPRQHGRQRGAAAYLGYPTQTLATLAPRVLELDFIGPRYLAGSAAPLHFVGVSCQRAPRLRYFYRVESVTTAALLTVCADLLQRHEHPVVLKVDNAPVTIGSGSAPRTVSRFVQWLWARAITPVFAVPRQPFSQASIEGNNSVFARKFWRARLFTSVADVDRQLTGFNRASLAYTGYAPPPPAPPPATGFTPRIHFLRQVRERDGATGIDVLHTWVPLAACYAPLFVLATWDLPAARLTVRLEREGTSRIIARQPFHQHHAP